MLRVESLSLKCTCLDLSIVIYICISNLYCSISQPTISIEPTGVPTISRPPTNIPTEQGPTESPSIKSTGKPVSFLIVVDFV